MRPRRTTAAAALVVALVALGWLLRTEGDRPPATAAADSTHVHAVEAPRAERLLTYADGQTIHLGPRQIDTGLDLLSLDVTDDGAAFTTFDGLLWFTDGATVNQIGLTTPAAATPTGISWGLAGRPEGRIVAESSGSLLAWLEYPRAAGHAPRPEVVVYDTHLQRRVTRVPILASPQCGACARIVAVQDRAVYWTDTPQSTIVRDDQVDSSAHLIRLDVSTQRQTQVSVRRYLEGLRARHRVLAVGDSPRSGTVGDAVGEDFAVVRGELVVHAMGPGAAAFDPATGRRVQVRMPSRYGDRLGPAQWFYLFEWLDDDRFALLDATGWNHGRFRGEDLLVCSISGHHCSVAARRPDSAGSPIVPSLSTPGSEIAAARAAHSPAQSDRVQR